MYPYKVPPCRCHTDNFYLSDFNIRMYNEEASQSNQFDEKKYKTYIGSWNLGYNMTAAIDTIRRSSSSMCVAWPLTSQWEKPGLHVDEEPAANSGRGGCPKVD